MNRFITAAMGLALVATPLVASTGAATATANVATAQRAAAPAYSVSASISQTTAVADEDTVKIRGKVSPRAAGEKVVLQQRMEGKKTWKKSGTATIKPTGKFVVKDDPSTAGTRFYRVLKPANDGMAKGTSKELELVVYKWESLTQRSNGAQSNIQGLFGITNATIATKAYNFSLLPIQSGTPSYVEYTLGRLCTSLRATYALDDRSESGAAGAVKLIVDGVVKADQGLLISQVVESTTDLTNAFRIRYELTSQVTPTSRPAIGTPEVLCTT